MIMHICRLMLRRSELAIFKAMFYVLLIFDNDSLTDTLVQINGPRCSCHIYPLRTLNWYSKVWSVQNPES